MLIRKVKDNVSKLRRQGCYLYLERSLCVHVDLLFKVHTVAEPSYTVLVFINYKNITINPD